MARTAIRETPGTASLISSRRLPASAVSPAVVTPVMLPPGRERLATQPLATGSPPKIMTIGIVAVVSLGGLNRRLAQRDDDVHLEPHQLAGQLGKTVEPAIRESPLDDDGSGRGRSPARAGPRGRGSERWQPTGPGPRRARGCPRATLCPTAAPGRRTARREGHQPVSRGMLAGRSLDHLIRPLQERRRDRQAEGLGSLEVDHQLEFRRLARLGRSPGLAPFRIRSTYVAARRYSRRIARAYACETSRVHEFPIRVDRRGAASSWRSRRSAPDETAGRDPDSMISA